MGIITDQLQQHVEPIFRLIYDDPDQAAAASEEAAERAFEVMVEEGNIARAAVVLREEIKERLEEAPPDLTPEEQKELGEAVRQAGLDMMGDSEEA